MMQGNRGFTLIELMIVIAIIGILASLAVSAYQTYTVRAQVSEGLEFASGAKVAIISAYTKNSSPPIDRAEAGMTPWPADSRGSYVAEVAVVNGRIDVTFGNGAHPDIAAETLSLTPYLTTGNAVVWRCGNAPAPAGATELTGGGITAEHQTPTVDARYLPGDCR
jgi:type IV pilus assembly protein PilA